jgi:hypothetical protein
MKKCTSPVSGILLLLAPTILSGCSGKGKVEPWSPTTTYFFSDRREAKWEYKYAVQDRQVVVQVASFPGYKVRTWYSAEVPDELMEQMKSWATRRGDITPPFEPHGPWYCRIDLSSAKERERGQTWFSDDNKAVKSWFDLLRRTFVTDNAIINNLPRWIEEDEHFTRLLGL